MSNSPRSRVVYHTQNCTRTSVIIPSTEHLPQSTLGHCWDIFYCFFVSFFLFLAERGQEGKGTQGSEQFCKDIYKLSWNKATVMITLRTGDPLQGKSYRLLTLPFCMQLLITIILSLLWLCKVISKLEWCLDPVTNPSVSLKDFLQQNCEKPKMLLPWEKLNDWNAGRKHSLESNKSK